MFSKTLALVAPAILCACTNLVSGGRTIPVTPNDAESMSQVRAALFAPNLTVHENARRPVLILKFAFDGTLNDRSRIPSDERETIVSYIAHRVPNTIYYVGVGMHGRTEDFLDAAVGSSMLKTAVDAKEDFFRQSGPFLREHPDGEIRVFVTGFSRGAGSARQFMNLVDESWQKKRSGNVTTVPKLRFYALLYDTVSTGQNDNPSLHLGLPRDLNYSLQFVAYDEPRELYAVDIDHPEQDDPGQLTRPKRINTVYLPGAHSDVGASYSAGIGDYYREITDYSLSMLGLIPDQCFETSRDATLQGKHDSRGWLDRLMQVAAPNTSQSVPRSHRYVTPSHITAEEAAEIAASNQALSAINYNRLTEFITHRKDTFGFTATRNGAALQLTSVSESVLLEDARLRPAADGGAYFDFSFSIAPTIHNTVHFSPRVIEHITATGSTVGVTYLAIANGQRFNIFVDNVLVDYEDWTQGRTTVVSAETTCPVNAR
ncbi:hypothetical protein ACLKMY_21100 [Paraburkholderia mimosarum]|uniref:hypothetical protein n=1 Tax=Paraburkholderia mimosarum TaxID=312026 RepID=UPI0039C0DB37